MWGMSGMVEMHQVMPIAFGEATFLLCFERKFTSRALKRSDIRQKKIAPRLKHGLDEPQSFA
jgi:hypothetical protein